MGVPLFLDELPSLAQSLQAKLLTVLEDHSLRRVGATRPIAVDSRIIAATNADLGVLVTAGKFREDLLHRLDLFRVRLPRCANVGTTSSYSLTPCWRGSVNATARNRP